MSVHLDDAAGRAIQPADQVQERALAGPGRPHQRQELATADLEVNALEHVHVLRAAPVVLLDALHPDERVVQSAASRRESSLISAPLP